jgi:beta-lactamase class D
MRNLLALVFSIMLSANAYANPNYTEIFKGSESCFILYDLNTDKTVEVHNSKFCNKPASPCSTFKVALSLMGFDSEILIDENNPLWDFKPGYTDWLEVWKQAHTPKTWMERSVVWYSQVMTKQLGMPKVKDYLKKFSYGNQDMTGNPGKNDGLTNAWLNSSLKISPKEQITFLKKLKNAQLPVSKYAIDKTQEIMFVEQLPNGWNLYGKTGSGNEKNKDGSSNQDRQTGWFVGWVEKGQQTYLFALYIHDKQKFELPGGKRARESAKEVLNHLNLLS